MASEMKQVVVQLRSDTFTRPSEKMLEAMISSQRGVDVSSYDEDPITIGLMHFFN